MIPLRTSARWCAWSPSTQTALALLAGLVSVALSAALIPLATWPVAAALVRDLAQIFLVGILLPLAWDAPTLWRAAYVAVALVFELVFFYGFLRTPSR